MRLSWIRIDLEVPDHPKMRKLARLTGKPDAWANMVRLWMWFLKYHPEGVLTDVDAVGTAEDGADWRGEPGKFIEAATACGLLSSDGDTLTVHDWNDHTGADIAKAQKEADRFKELRTKKRQSSTTAEQVPARPANEDKVSAEPVPHTVRTACEHGENKNKLKLENKIQEKSTAVAAAPAPPIQPSPLFAPGEQRDRPQQPKASRRVEPKPGAAEERAERDQYRDAYRRLYEQPRAECGTGGVMAFKRARTRYGLDELIRALEALRGDERFGATLGLDQTLAESCIQKGINLANGHGARDSPRGSHRPPPPSLAQTDDWYDDHNPIARAGGSHG